MHASVAQQAAHLSKADICKGIQENQGSIEKLGRVGVAVDVFCDVANED
jgi:hypothetical protein